MRKAVISMRKAVISMRKAVISMRKASGTEQPPRLHIHS